MANRALRLPHNAPGDFFVDSTCIDCDQCRSIAPEVFGDAPSEATVVRQPATPETMRAALKALVSCPVGAIGSEERHDARSAALSFPELVEDEVYFCGFAARSSYGASSYFIRRAGGNVLVDSPRFAAQLVRRMEELGGIRWIFLSHVDDIADHARFQRHFGCERIIHSREAGGRLGNIERKLRGDSPIAIAEDLVAIPTPGHTAGHTVLLYRDKFLFSGDHLWWSPEQGRLAASRSYCWYSWPKQIESMERLLDYRFEWVLPGHGRRFHAHPSAMRAALALCIERMWQGE